MQQLIKSLKKHRRNNKYKDKNKSSIKDEIDNQTSIKSQLLQICNQINLNHLQ